MHATLEHLTLLKSLEIQQQIAEFYFFDGDIYKLRVISTMHAEEGDDIVAEVVNNVISVTGTPIPDGSFMNFKLTELKSINT